MSGRPSTTPFMGERQVNNQNQQQQISTPRSNFNKRLSGNFGTEQRISPKNNIKTKSNNKVLNPEKENINEDGDKKEIEIISIKCNGGEKIQEEEPAVKIEYLSPAFFALEKLIQTDKQLLKTEMIVQYVDFSTKYGIGYKLTNGSYGVLFNDSTRIVLDPNYFHFDYIQKSLTNGEEEVQHLDFFNYPKLINKKVILLQHFKSYLDGNQKFKPLDFNFGSENPPIKIGINNQQETLSHLKKWKKAKKAILFRLSNKLIQVVF